ncbi:hypothetical protein WICMUC_002786 [Wickerhamomyces mucosus]|uniref:Glutamate--tRNA ligase, mitochondrial n=1 Tax=Wickerhamomyces mucosus TaxID=1378264 RepID=A0A9P8PP71_9ASCO|nr:hypothetical protein WICMUC_002786 [Wickerhamomyces mucosus]
MRRFYSTLKPRKKLSILSKKNVQLNTPARTRFAPSPTGFLHMGSLRTALYNYLLAKHTGGQFLLRLEDTDQKRLIKGAENNIYESLKWCGLNWDEGPIVGGPHEPYRQSDRSLIYQKYTDKLIKSNNAYRCFCSKTRLDGLRESAQKLTPPTTVSYDRNCAHLSKEESSERAKSGELFTVRFKSPGKYPKFNDLLHGNLDLQPQVNKDDVRYDDFVLMKSDNLPTYHFANVIDDHLMKISHVIRGEEWLPSTPKHIALYSALGWEPPQFIHIPLLTSTKDKKLSKRSGDIDVMNFAKKGILPEALINFVSLFGWSPKNKDSNSEVLDLNQLVKAFDINDLTKGNAKVEDKKLYFFNKTYLLKRMENNDKEIFNQGYELLSANFPDLTKDRSDELIKTVGHNLTTIQEITEYGYLISLDYSNDHTEKFLGSHNLNESRFILSKFQHLENIEEIDSIINSLKISKKDVFKTLRFALAASKPGLNIPSLVKFLGIETTNYRLEKGLEIIESKLNNTSI